MGKEGDQILPPEVTQTELPLPPVALRLVIAPDVPLTSVEREPIPSVEELREMHNLVDESWFSNVWSLRFMEIVEINPKEAFRHNPVNITEAVRFWRCPADFYVPKKPKPKDNRITRPSHTKERPKTRGQAQLVFQGPKEVREQLIPKINFNENLVMGDAYHKFMDIVHAEDFLETIQIDPIQMAEDPEYAFKAFTEDYLTYLRDIAKRDDKRFIEQFDRLGRDGKWEQMRDPIDKYLTMHKQLGSEVITSEQKYAYYLQGRRHPFKLGGHKSREVPVYGRFDQVRQIGDRIQIIEAKTSITDGNRHSLELQTGMEFLGIQSVLRRMIQEGKLGEITEEKVSQLFMPDLLGYNFTTGELHQLIITDLGEFVSSLRNILFDTHILMSVKYPGRNPDHDARYCVGEDEEKMAEFRDMTVQIGQREFSLDERYSALQKQLEHYKETYVWAPVDLSAPLRRRSFIPPERNGAGERRRQPLSRVTFSIPGAETVPGQLFTRRPSLPSEELKWKQKPGVLKVDTGRELGGPDTQKILENMLFARTKIADTDRERYLNPTLSEISAERIGLDTNLLEQAYRRIDDAIEGNESIFIIGHRDFDGIAGTVIVTEALEAYRKQADEELKEQHPAAVGQEKNQLVIPDFPSWEEGYGLTRNVVNRLAKTGGKKLFITVDLGSSSEDGIQYAKSLGIDTIVIDHHKTGESSSAHSLIHTDTVSAAGIAFVFAEGIWPSANRNELQKRLEIAGAAQVADNLPMTDGPARVLAKFGYESFKNPERKGLQELAFSAKIKPGFLRKMEFDMYKYFNDELRYQIIPLINAGGRVGEPMDCFNLLTAKDQYSADLDVDAVLEAYEQQKFIVEQAYFAARNTLRQAKTNDRINFLVTDSPIYGVNGLVAQKVMEDTGLPTIVLSRHGDVYSGSGRSIRTFNLRGALEEQAHLIQSDGGPAGASGIRVLEEDLVPLREALVGKANRELTNRRLERILSIDMPLSFMHLDLAYEVEKKFGPFGKGNEQPIHSTRGITMSTHKSDVRYFGEGKHVELVLHRGGSREVKAVGFYFGPRIREFIAQEKKRGEEGVGIDVAYSLVGDRRDPTHAMLLMKSFRKGTIREHKKETLSPQDARMRAALSSWPEKE